MQRALDIQGLKGSWRTLDIVSRWTDNMRKMPPLLSFANGSVYCLFLWDLWKRSAWREYSGFFSKKQLKKEQNHQLRAWICRVPILSHAVSSGTGAAISLNFMKFSSTKFNSELTHKLGQYCEQFQSQYVIFEVVLCRSRWILWSLWGPSNSRYSKMVSAELCGWARDDGCWHQACGNHRCLCLGCCRQKNTIIIHCDKENIQACRHRPWNNEPRIKKSSWKKQTWSFSWLLRNS